MSRGAVGRGGCPRPVTHASFTITRQWKASPVRVFQSPLPTEQAKAKWFAGPPGFEQHEKGSFDFREGGRETLSGRPLPQRYGLQLRLFLYRDIVLKEQSALIYSYVRHLDGKKISSLPGLRRTCPRCGRTGTKLVLTEYGD